MVEEPCEMVPLSGLGLFSPSLLWRHNGRGSVSKHQPHDCLLNLLFGRRPKKTPKLRVTGLCAENSPRTGVFPAQMASIAENVSIWWRHRVICSRLIAHLWWSKGHARWWRWVGLGCCIPCKLIQNWNALQLTCVHSRMSQPVDLKYTHRIDKIWQ